MILQNDHQAQRGQGVHRTCVVVPFVRIGHGEAVLPIQRRAACASGRLHARLHRRIPAGNLEIAERYGLTSLPCWSAAEK